MEARKPEALGVSLKLEDGDLAFRGGDLDMVSGRDNLLQGLVTMIGTPFGSDAVNVGYGFDLESAVIQPRSLALMKDLIRLNIVKALALDSRVQEVREVVFDDHPRFYELVPATDPDAARLRRKHRRRWGAAVVVVANGGQELTLELEGTGV